MAPDNDTSIPRRLAQYIDAARQLRDPVTRGEVEPARLRRNQSKRCGACDYLLSHDEPYGYLERVSGLGLCLYCIDAILATNAVRVPLVGRCEA